MQKKCILIMTHSTDDQDRSNGAMALAASLLAEGVDLALFFMFQGALLAKRGVAETIEGRNFAPVRDLWPALLEAGIPMYLCGACAKTYEISEQDLVDGVKIVHLPSLAGEMLTREAITL